MNPEEIKTLIETVLIDKVKYFWIYILLSVIIGFIAAYSMEYFKNKGKNLATKQDIEVITQKVEQVKFEIQNNQEIANQKRELKYNAILTSLKLIDARLSNFIIGDNIKKQYATTEETRECHSRLILTCNNSKIIESFENIMMKKLPTDSTGTQYVIRELEKYRSLVREELGFGNPIITNPDLIWIGDVPFEKK